MSTTEVSLHERHAELKARYETIAGEIAEFAARVEAGENLTPEQSERLERQSAAANRLAGQIEEVRELREAKIREFASKPDHVENGDGARHTQPEFMRRAEDPWAGDLARSAMHQTPMQIRDRALVALERSSVADDAATLAEPLVRDAHDVTSLASRWAIATSNPAYSSAFFKALVNPHVGAAQFDENERAAYVAAEEVRTAMSEGSVTNGGYLVPAQLDPAINILNAGCQNPIRKIARVEQVVGFQWQPVNSSGITAEWHSTESVEFADASPTISRPTIQVYAADAYVESSWELTQDHAQLGAEVQKMMIDAKDRLESAAFINGTGGGQPWGLMTRLTAIAGTYVFGNSGSTVEADIKLSDVYAMDAALPARYSQNAAWLAHKYFYGEIKQRIAESNGGGNGLWTEFEGAAPAKLNGYPTYISSELDSAVVSGSQDEVCILGDFRNYIVVDRIGFQLAFNPWVVGSNRRATGTSAWAGFWRVGGDLLDPTNGSGFVHLHK